MPAHFRLLLPACLALSPFMIGCGSDDDGPTGPVSSGPPAVGAAYSSPNDDRVILVNAAGTRWVYFDPGDGSFTAPRAIAELEAGFPLANVGAAAHWASTGVSESVFFDTDGQTVAYIDRGATAPSFELRTLGVTAFTGAPFDAIGAAFSLSTNAFLFERGGANYVAYNTSTGNWSPIYSFASDFGGGGAPIANVGASFSTADDHIVLFNLAGTRFTTYLNNGNFTPAFDIDELGDGSLRF